MFVSLLYYKCVLLQDAGTKFIQNVIMVLNNISKCVFVKPSLVFIACAT